MGEKRPKTSAYLYTVHNSEWNCIFGNKRIGWSVSVSIHYWSIKMKIFMNRREIYGKRYLQCKLDWTGGAMELFLLYLIINPTMGTIRLVVKFGCEILSNVESMWTTLTVWSVTSWVFKATLTLIWIIAAIFVERQNALALNYRQTICLLLRVLGLIYPYTDCVLLCRADLDRASVTTRVLLVHVLANAQIPRRSVYY